jgi:CHAT domain-containing protein
MFRTRIFAGLFALLFVLPLHADERVERAIHRALADYANGDLDRFLAAWRDGAETREPVRKQLAGILRVRCLRSAGVVIESLSIDGKTASARALVGFSKTSPADRTVWQPVEMRLIDLTLAEENGSWKITRFVLAEEALAASLIAAQTRDERNALLAKNPRLITPELVRVLYRKALSLTNTDRPDSARLLGALATELAEEISDTGGLALLRGLSGIHHRRLTEYDAAMKDSLESLALAETTGDPDILSRAWLNLARVRQMRGQFSEESVFSTLRALAFAENAEDPILLIRALQDGAWDYFWRGDFYMARLHAERQLTLIGPFGDRWSEIDVQTLLSDLYSDQRDYERAEFHLDRALAIARRTDYFFTASILGRKASIRMERGQHDEAPPIIDEAERRARALNDNTTLGHMAELRGRMLAREGRAADAECEMRAGAALRSSDGYPNRLDFEVLAREELQRGRYRNAIRLALDYRDSVHSTEPYLAIVPLQLAATAFRKLGEAEQALGVLEEAIDLSEYMRHRVQGNERQRASWNERAHSPYAHAADLLVEMKRPELALEYAERAKSQVLVDVLLHGRAASTASLTEDEARTERAYESRLAALNRALDEARATETSEKLRAQIASERAAYESFRDGVAVRHAPPRNRDVRVPSIAEMSATLAPNQAFIEYLIGEDDVHIWVIRKDGFRLHSVPVARDVLQKKIDEAAERLAERSLRFREPVQELHSLLLAPIEEELRDVRSLIIVPDGALWRVPFSALIDREQHYVAERWAVTLAPSITTYRIMSDRERMQQRPGGRTLLAVSNPTIDRSVKANVVSYYRSADLGPLPHAEWETNALRAIYGADHSTTLTGNRARESAVKAAAWEHGILHFATHGIFDDRSPMYSRLVLARDEATGDDGYLETWEIAKLDLQADLVVLSACDTARGTVGGGEGVMGMAWSFFVAGARSTVATQWKVNSASTATLMVAFHRDLASLGRSESLRRAQLTLLRTPVYAHPFYWAPFVVIGGS